MQKTYLPAVALAALIAAPSASLAQATSDRYGPHMMWWGGYGMFMGPVLLIVGLAVAIAIALFVVRGAAGTQNPPAPPSKTPLDILKERFARGEIDKTEYEDRRRALEE